MVGLLGREDCDRHVERSPAFGLCRKADDVHRRNRRTTIASALPRTAHRWHEQKNRGGSVAAGWSNMSGLIDVKKRLRSSGSCGVCHNAELAESADQRAASGDFPERRLGHRCDVRCHPSSSSHAFPIASTIRCQSLVLFAGRRPTRAGRPCRLFAARSVRACPAQPVAWTRSANAAANS